MPPTITAFERSPDRGKGLARDMRVRWALEEVGQPYDVRLVSFTAMKEPAHLALHPFGQIPTYEEGDLALFESGAIVFHIAERHAGLLPDNANARARAIAWMFAALNTVEPPIFDRSLAKILDRDEPWYEQRLRFLEDSIRKRLGDLSRRLGGADWLDGAFSAGDLLMVTVLRRLEGSGMLEEYPNLSAYVARSEARPAYGAMSVHATKEPIGVALMSGRNRHKAVMHGMPFTTRTAVGRFTQLGGVSACFFTFLEEGVDGFRRKRRADEIPLYFEAPFLPNGL
jgi:glutathione S-transferase